MDFIIYYSITVSLVVIAFYLIMKFLWTRETVEEQDKILLQLKVTQKRLENYATELNGLLGVISSLHEFNLTPQVLNIEQVSKSIVENAVKLLGARQGSLFLINKKTNKLELKAKTGYSNTQDNQEKLELDSGVLSEVAVKGELVPIYRESFSQDLFFDQSPNDEGSFVSVPLKSQNKVIGIINISDKTQGGQFTNEDLRLLGVLADQAAVALENLTLYHNLQEMYLGAIKTLAKAVDAKDPYTKRHSERVTQYMMAMAEEMKLSEELRHTLECASMIHDIGKIGIREDVLNKTGRLTEEEFEEIKKHPVIGRDMIMPMESLREIQPLILYHHRHFDGGGYPGEPIKDGEIPLGARMIAVADAFDAMVSNRPYRQALPVEVAIKELQRCAGSQFDPEIVNVFVNILNKKNLLTY